MQQIWGGSLGLGGKYNAVAGTYTNFATIVGRKENSTLNNVAGYFAILTRANVDPLERMRVTSEGNVGIGTTAPEYGLHLGSNIAPKSLAFTIDNATQSGIIWKYIGQSKINAKISSVGNGAYANKGIAFYTTDSADTITDAVERMRITEGGNVGIGTASPGTIKLYVETNAANYAQYIYNPHASGNGLGIQAAIDSSHYALNVVTGNNNPLFMVRGDGNVGIGTTGPNQKLDVAGTIRQSGCITAGTLSANTSGDIICTPSSQRFKDNRTDITNGLSTLLLLQPVSYTFKPEMDMGTEIHFGFISEEVSSVLPQLATHDTEGNPYGLDNNAILAITVNAIKEMDIKVTSIADMEQENTWRDSLLAWFANATNGIGDFFANRVRTKELCVEKSDGTEFCANGDQFEAMLENSGSYNNNTNTPTPEPEPTPSGDGSPVEEPTSDPAPEETPTEDPAPTPEETTPPAEEPPVEEPLQEGGQATLEPEPTPEPPVEESVTEPTP